MPMMGGISCPPSDDAVSMEAATTRGMPAPIMAGMVAEPVVMAFAALLPLTEATARDPSTADCGSACGDRTAISVGPVKAGSTQQAIYFGDIHNHNALGYGKGSLQRSIEIAREYAC